jgi:hypothetical protein
MSQPSENISYNTMEVLFPLTPEMENQIKTSRQEISDVIQ